MAETLSEQAVRAAQWWAREAHHAPEIRDMARSLLEQSEQVAELERERDRLKRGIREAEYARDYWFREREALETKLAQARVEAARRALTRLAADCTAGKFRAAGNDKWRSVADDVDVREFRDREYPATGEEPTRVHGPFCDADCACGKGNYRPAPSAVTEPPEDEAWGWAVVNKNGNLTTSHQGHPAIITATEARRRGMPRNGGDWIDALCVLLNANTGDEFAPFTVVRLHAWGALASRLTASGEG